MNKNPSKFKKTVLTISITFIFVFFVGYGIETFYKSPNYDSYCNQSRLNPQKNIENKEDCENLNGTWETLDNYKNNYEEEYNKKEGFCDLFKKCDQKWNSVIKEYNKNVFIISFIIGLLSLITGAYFIKIESVGSGIMGGGTLTIIYGTLRYWSNLDDLIRFIILGIVLFILIWIGYKKIKE